MLDIAFTTGIEVDEFFDASAELLQPLEDFFDSVFVMVVCLPCLLPTINGSFKIALRKKSLRLN